MINVFCWVPRHSDISGNEKADRAAKAALKCDVSALEVPYPELSLNLACSSGWISSPSGMIRSKINW